MKKVYGASTLPEGWEKEYGIARGIAEIDKFVVGPESPQWHNFTVPVSKNNWLTISGKFPLSGDEWNRLIATLETMRPGLTNPIGMEVEPAEETP